MCPRSRLDVLDQFNAPQKQKRTPHVPSATTSQAQRSIPGTAASQQAADVGNNASKDPDPNFSPDNELPPGFEKELAEGMEALMREFGQTAHDDADASDGFQRTIREAMDKLKSSEDTLKVGVMFKTISHVFVSFI